MGRTLEFWVKVRDQNRVLRGLTGLSLLVTAAMALAVVRASQRPPFVIRVDPSGEARLLSGREGAARPELVEARFFATDFLKHFLAPSAASVAKDLSRALAMMTPELQREHAEAFRKNSYVRNVERLKVQTVVFFGDILAHKQGESYVVRAEGIVETRRQGIRVPVRRHFSTRMGISPVPRNDWNIQGLLIEDLRLSFDSEAGVGVWEDNGNRPSDSESDDAT